MSSLIKWELTCNFITKIIGGRIVIRWYGHLLICHIIYVKKKTRLTEKK